MIDNDRSCTTDAAPAPANGPVIAAELPNTSMHWQETLRDGTRVLIRPVHADDAAIERAFVERLSPEARANRFLGQVAVTDDLIRKLTTIDYQRDMAFVALHHESGSKAEIGASRLYRNADQASCECSVVVADAWQGKGLGTILMRHLIDEARRRGFKRMISIDAVGNTGMRKLALELGFVRTTHPDYRDEAVHTLEL